MMMPELPPGCLGRILRSQWDMKMSARTIRLKCLIRARRGWQNVVNISRQHLSQGRFQQNSIEQDERRYTMRYSDNVFQGLDVFHDDRPTAGVGYGPVQRHSL